MSDHNHNEFRPHEITGPETHNKPAGSFLNLSALAVREKAVTLFLLLAVLAAGIFAFFKLGQS